MAEAGWYADPSDPDEIRYWDGQGWADPPAPDASTAAPQASAPPPPIAPAAMAPAPAVMAPEPAVMPPPVAPPAPGAGAGFGSPAVSAAPAAFATPAPMAAPPMAAPAPAAPAAGAWGAPPTPGGGLPGGGLSGGATPGGVTPGAAPAAASTAVPMQQYTPGGMAATTAGRLSARTAWATVLLGMQSTIPLIFGFFTMATGAAFSSGGFRDEFGGGYGGSYDSVGGGFTIVGAITIALGLMLLIGGVGTALRRTWGRVLALVAEALIVAGVVYTLTQSGSVVSAILGLLIPVSTIVLIVSDRSAA